MKAPYLYAVIGEIPRAALGTGIFGEPLEVVEAGLFAVIGRLSGVPVPDEPSLRAHDAAVRRIAKSVDAVLPARFGCVPPGDLELRRLLELRREVLERALELVAGAEQMTLRAFVERPTEPPKRSTPSRGASRIGPGTKYLRDRARDLEASRRALDPLRKAVGRWVRAERIDDPLPRASRDAPLIASAHHLVAREKVRQYRDALVRAAHRNPSLRAFGSGPSPAYAFAPELAP
jgi:hypothetical protein